MNEIIQLANKAMNMLEDTDLNNKDKTLITDVIHEIRKQAFSLNGVSGMFSAEKVRDAWYDGVKSEEKQIVGDFDIENYR